MRTRTIGRGALTALLLALLLLCAGCGPAGGEGENTGAPPEETGAQESPAPESPAPAEPVEYDFSDVTLDEQTRALTGFEGLPWGYALPPQLLADLPEMPVVSIMNGNARFAGLSMMAYYSFQRGQEGGDPTLRIGEYVRQGYSSQEDWMEQATADFNQVTAYLTELYGEPTTYVLSFDDGSAPEDLTAPLSAAQFGAEGVDGCAAYWHELEGAAISVRLEDSYGGALFVTFGQKPVG